MTKEEIEKLPTNVRAAYIAGLFDGLSDMRTARQRRIEAVKLLPFAQTAKQATFEAGPFNPISVWEMLAEFERRMKK